VLIPVILSGGAGTRLWPVSRQAHPKPFMRMGDGQTLLYKTLQRALAVAPQGPVWTVTGRDYLFLSRDEYRQDPAGEAARLGYLLEPAGRNTAPAIALAALKAQAEYGDAAVLLVLPADHLVRETPAFAEAVVQAQSLAQQGWLVTFGIRPSHPETGFGYIHAGAAIEGSQGHAIEAFVEKPDRARAEAYLAAGHYYWNSGMFCFTAGAFIAELEHASPEVLRAARACLAASPDFDDEGALYFERESFLKQPDISVDYAVMEHARRAAVVPAGFDWSDIGSWKAISELEEADAAGNRVSGQAIVVDSRDCYIQAEGRVIAAVGVHDLIIVDTGDAVLVADRERAQQVRSVVDQLRADRHAAATHHLTVHRPWGSYTVLEDAHDCKVKRLTVKPGGILSLQVHQRRSEHWTVVDGTATVRVGEREFELKRNESTYIPMGTVHRLENRTPDPLHLIETQCGDYFGEDDIVRLEDVYGRR
jgi:mannose-1-phosphate guanylyltransferase / mannose-6-phosphate isomerase